MCSSGINFFSTPAAGFFGGLPAGLVIATGAEVEDGEVAAGLKAEDEGLRLNISVIFAVCDPGAAFGGEVGFLSVFSGSRGGFIEVAGADREGQ